jgi:isopentenyl-diphosphate delta-isomerase
VHHRATPLHLAFSCYVFDPAGERLLLTRRAASKATWPGVWTNSCCGHPQPGEPLAEAVRRRLHEELGLAVADLRLLLPCFRYRAEMANGVREHELCPVFCAVTDREPTPHAAEVADHRWVAWRELASEVLAGARAVSPWCVAQVRELASLGDGPSAWPDAPSHALPPAARLEAADRAMATMSPRIA